jgi:hypothetical protein
MHACSDEGEPAQRRALRACARTWIFGLNRLLLAAWVLASSLIRWLLSLLPCRKAHRAQTYTGPRMHAVRRLAAGWAGSSSGNGHRRHPLAKPDWVKSAVLQLAHDLPNVGCRTLANSFNLAHAPSGQSISKTWVASVLKAQSVACLGAAQIKAQKAFYGLWRADSARLGR